MSVRGAIVDAARTIIRALAVPGLPAADVVVRKRFVHDKLTERQRQIVLVSEDEQYIEEVTGGGLTLAYPLFVGIVMERGLREEQAKWEWDAREAIRHALFVTHLPGAPTVNNCEYDPKPAFEGSSWGEKFDLSAQLFRYRSDEGRNA